MISKYLTIAAAVVLISGSAFAQDNSAAPPASSTPAATAPATPAPAPAATPEVKAPAPAAVATDNPYGLGDIIEQEKSGVAHHSRDPRGDVGRAPGTSSS